MKKFFKKIIVSILQLEAQFVLKKYKPKIIAVTGSVGKTSTKDAIYSALATTFFVRKSSKSFNTEIGVPLTILGLPNARDSLRVWLRNLTDGLMLVVLPNKYPEWLVIEVGADRPGDIRSITRWLKPDVAVITRLGEVPVHVEFFGSAEQVKREKAELVHATPPTGIVILNADDEMVSSMRAIAKGKVITYGTNSTADLFGSDFNVHYTASFPSFPTGVSFIVHSEDKKIPVKIESSLGRQQMYIALAAFATAKALDLNLEVVAKHFAGHSSPPGRMKLLSGIHNSCIIDDTYNSSPVAAAEALETLKALQASGRKIAVLGDMLELGAHSKVEHEKLGEKAHQAADIVYTVGTRAKWAHDFILSHGGKAEKNFWFVSSEEAAEALQKNIREGDIVLVKGSQAVRMEKVVKAILAEHERASELLVRQEEEWAKR